MSEDRWLDVARAILDGSPVSWETVSERSADDPASVDSMQLLAAVAEVYRRPHDSDEHHWGLLELLEKIGSGAFGVVYRARDTALDREVALKLLDRRPEAAAIDEGRLLARVRHPNVVTLHGAAEYGGRYGIWMEFVRGRTLASIVADDGPLQVDDAIRIGVDVCRALAAVHAAGLVHGDVKAQNVMREGEGGRIVLMDFGTGQFVENPARLAGTPLYLAPEILNGAPADMRADVYSAGVLLYYLLTGAFPVEGRNLREVGVAHASGNRVGVRERRRDVPAALAGVIHRGLSPDPSTRFGSAEALGHALLQTVSFRWHRWAVGWIFILLLLGIGAGIIWKREHTVVDAAVSQPETVTTNSAEALHLYTESYRLGDKDDFAAALPLVKRAVALDPSFALAHTWEAWCLLNTGAPEGDVRAEAQRALALSNRVTEWERLWIQGSYDKFTGQTEAEIATFKNLLKLRPNDYWAIDSLANTLGSLGLNSEWLAYVARRADLRPDNGRNAMFAGLYLIRAGDHDRGLRYAEHARMVARTGGWFGGAQFAWAVPVEDALQRSDYRTAATILDQLGREFTDRPSNERTAIAKLLVVYNLDLGRATAAMLATDLIDDSEMRHVNRASVAFHAGDVRWAQEMRFVKGPVSAQDSRVFYLIEAGRFDDATKVLHAFTLPNTDQSGAEVEVAHIELKKGQIDQALQTLEHARPGGSVTESITRFEYLADIYQQRRDRADAITALETSLQVRDSQMLAFWWMRNEVRLAELYHEVGRDADARPLERELDKRFSVADPTFPLVVRLRALEAKTASSNNQQ